MCMNSSIPYLNNSLLYQITLSNILHQNSMFDQLSLWISLYWYQQLPLNKVSFYEVVAAYNNLSPLDNELQQLLQFNMVGICLSARANRRFRDVSKAVLISLSVTMFLMIFLISWANPFAALIVSIAFQLLYFLWQHSSWVCFDRPLYQTNKLNVYTVSVNNNKY